MKTRQKALLILWVLVFGVVMLVVVAARRRPPLEIRVFERHVLKPIPPSVAGIRLHEATGSFGCTHILRFRISRGEAASIVASRPFEEFGWVWYSNYNVSSGNLAANGRDPRQNTMFGVAVESVPVREHGKLWLPDWFGINDWENPEVWRVHQKWGRAERDHIQLFVYNERIGEAYFINHFARGLGVATFEVSR